MNDIKFTYIRDTTNRVVTIARRWNDLKDHMEYQFAVCNPKDHFSKKLGRTIAVGRLNTQAFLVHVAKGEHPEDNVLRDITQHTVHVTPELVAERLYHRACSRLDRSSLCAPNCS